MQPLPQPILEYFHHPQNKYCTFLAITANPLPSPTPPLPSTRQWLLCFLPVWICLFWTFQINDIRQYVFFCKWLLSLSIRFLRFIHVVGCISISFLYFCRKIFNFMDIPYFVYPFISWRTFELASFCVDICCQFSLNLGVEFLGHVVTLCLILQGTAWPIVLKG